MSLRHGTSLKLLMFLMFCITWTAALPKESPKRPCSQDEAMRAEKEIDNLKDWDQMCGWYRRFSRCDDGAIGEGYSDAVGQLLANRWEDFGKLAKLAATDNEFQSFVLKHIDETIPADTLGKIRRNASTDCPSSRTKLCRLVAKAASP